MKRMTLLRAAVAVMLVAAAGALSACAAPTEPAVAPVETLPVQPSEEPATPAAPTPTPEAGGVPGKTGYLASDLARQVPTVAAGDLEALVAGNRTFAVDLYHAVGGEGNMIFSPYSISLALAMAYAGARGETGTQMADVLSYTLPQERLHPAFNALDQSLNALGDVNPMEASIPFQLSIANAAWGQQDYAFHPEYLDTLALNYGAGLRLVDFIGEPEPSRLTINDWVEEQTEGRIADLIPQGVITPDTRLVLTNAIYFYGAWAEEFMPEATRDEPFFLLDGSSVTVPMMRRTALYPYLRGENFTAVSLPYQGYRASMTIIMPDEGQFPAFEQALTGDRLAEIMGEMLGASVELGMPRFEFTSDLSLSDTLPAMGMPDAFDPGVADFTGIADPIPYRLFISDVIHKAFIKVDEKGTEAAAATAVVMGLGAAPMENVTLTLDHPFIFVITDQQTGSILFMGRVVNPAG